MKTKKEIKEVIEATKTSIVDDVESSRHLNIDSLKEDAMWIKVLTWVLKDEPNS